MATVPGNPGQASYPSEMLPTRGDLLTAAQIMHEQGMFQLPDQPVVPTPNPSGEGLRKQMKATPKEQIDPERARGTPVEPEVLAPSIPSEWRGGRQFYGIGRT